MGNVHMGHTIFLISQSKIRNITIFLHHYKLKKNEHIYYA